MGNLLCLNCFKTGLEEGEQAQPIQLMPDKESDIKLLEDADLLSHIDLQQLQFENRVKQNKEKRSFNRISFTPTYIKSQSMKVLPKSRPPRYSLNMKVKWDDKTVAFGKKNEIAPKADNYYTSYFSGQESESNTGLGVSQLVKNQKNGFLEAKPVESTQLPLRKSTTLKHQRSSEMIIAEERGSFASKKKQSGVNFDKDSHNAMKELDDFKNILDSNVPSPIKDTQNFIVTSGTKKTLIDPRHITSSGKKSEDTNALNEEEKDKVEALSTPHLGPLPTKSLKISPDMKSMKSISFEPSLYSFKSCNEFDNLTFHSLLSSKSTTKRFTGSKIKKQDIFHEFMFEIEQFSDYFNLTNSYPLEEVIFDKKGATNKSEKYLSTFCPKIIEIEPENSTLPSTNRRIIITRGIFILKTSIRELQVSLNRKIEGPATRFVQKRLYNCSDFDNEVDALLKYNLVIGGSNESLKTVRIGTGKKFPKGKTIHYLYERSVNLNDFYQTINDTLPIVPGTSPSNQNPPCYLLKSVHRIEVLSEDYLKMDFYCEYYVPEKYKLSQARVAIKELLTLSIEGAHL